MKSTVTTARTYSVCILVCILESLTFPTLSWAPARAQLLEPFLNVVAHEGYSFKQMIFRSSGVNRTTRLLPPGWVVRSSAGRFRTAGRHNRKPSLLIRASGLVFHRNADELHWFDHAITVKDFGSAFWFRLIDVVDHDSLPFRLHS